jgi:Tfp pilus assembly major pilin PilA
MNTPLQQGMTLIQFMTLIAVGGIAAAVAIHLYLDHAARAL